MATPVTVEVRRETSPERAGDAIEWIDRGLSLARSFDGCLGGGMLRDADDENVMHVVYRFRSEESLRAWEQSPQRAQWLETGNLLIDQERVQRRTGIEGWFDGPGVRRELDTRTGSIRTIGVRSAPVRWKQMCALWLGIYPTNFLVALSTSSLPWWGDVPIAVRTLIVASVLAPLMTFAVMPTVTRFMRPWLRRNPGVIQSERALREALDIQASNTK